MEHFMPILMEKEEEGMLSPILAHGGVRFMWIKHNNLYRIPFRGSFWGTHTHATKGYQLLPSLAQSWLKHSGARRPCPGL